MDAKADNDAEVRALTEAAAAGDRTAIDALLARYTSELNAFVRLRAGRLVRDRESSSDLVQSVCREILMNAERFQHAGEAAFKKWLYATALRKIRDRQAYYLADKRDVLRHAEPGAGEAPGEDQALVDHYRRFSTPSRRAVLRDEIERVEAAFDLLTETQREVVTLAHLVGLTRAEIAEQTGSTEGAVRTTLHRALARLSAVLTDPAETGGPAAAPPGAPDASESPDEV